MLVEFEDYPKKIAIEKRTEIERIKSEIIRPFRKKRERSDTIISNVSKPGCLYIIATIIICTIIGAVIGGIIGGIIGLVIGFIVQAKVEDFFIYMEFDRPKRELKFPTAIQNKLTIIDSVISKLNNFK